MVKKSAFQVLDFANEELRGKLKNLVWCDAEQKVLSIAVPESYEFSESDGRKPQLPERTAFRYFRTGLWRKEFFSCTA